MKEKRPLGESARSAKDFKNKRDFALIQGLQDFFISFLATFAPSRFQCSGSGLCTSATLRSIISL